MNDAMQTLLALNIVLLGVAALTVVMMIIWSRMTRGKWPSRKKFGLTLGFNLFVWIFGNACYF